MSLGKINYGQFKNTKSRQKISLYLTGKKNKVCFEHKRVQYMANA